MKRIALGILAAASAWAQQTTTYMVHKQTALTSAAEVVTIQQPSSGSKRVIFLSAYFDCSVACSFTLERNGTAASATTLTVNNLNLGETPPTTTAWSGSNVGNGTVLATYTCAAACSLPIDLTGLVFPPSNSTATNVTLRSSSITGTVDILFKYQESQ